MAAAPAVTDSWYLYVVRARGEILYTGITRDVARRFREHSVQGARCARALRGRTPLELVFSTAVGSHGQALRTELWMKAQPKRRKLAVIAGQLALPQFEA